MHSTHRLFQLAGRCVHTLGWFVLIAGVLLQITIRDRIDYVATIFYALPLPVLAGIAGTLSIWKTGRQFALSCAVIITAAWFSRSYFSHEPQLLSTGKREFRALYWNLDRPKTPSGDLIDLVTRLQPDVVGCGEPGANFMEQGTDYEKALPGYTCHLMPRGLFLLSKWPVKMLGRGKLDSLGAFAYFDVSAPQGTVRLVLVDVWADPLLPRKRSLDESLSYADGGSRCIIMGDFNTPSESVWFAPYRARLQDALETAGRGFRETWFWRLPVLSLDHVWIHRDWRVLEAQKINRWSSDHAAVLVRLE